MWLKVDSPARFRWGERSSGERSAIAELRGLDPGIECLSLVASSGDFVYFPPGWIHRVWTHEKSLGIGGYIQPKGTRSEILHAATQLEALGKDFVW